MRCRLGSWETMYLGVLRTKMGDYLMLVQKIK